MNTMKKQTLVLSAVAIALTSHAYATEFSDIVQMRSPFFEQIDKDPTNKGENGAKYTYKVFVPLTGPLTRVSEPKLQSVHSEVFFTNAKVIDNGVKPTESKKDITVSVGGKLGLSLPLGAASIGPEINGKREVKYTATTLLGAQTADATGKKVVYNLEKHGDDISLSNKGLLFNIQLSPNYPRSVRYFARLEYVLNKGLLGKEHIYYILDTSKLDDAPPVAYTPADKELKLHAVDANHSDLTFKKVDKVEYDRYGSNNNKDFVLIILSPDFGDNVYFLVDKIATSDQAPKPTAPAP